MNHSLKLRQNMYDVLISGAGPTGLALALWLTKQGNSVRIIDKTAEPGTTSRAMVVQARTLELYRQLELSDEVIAAGSTNFTMNFWVNGKRKAVVAIGDAGADITPYPFILTYPQDEHEKLLIKHLALLGVEVERNTELLAFEDHGDQISARLRLVNGEEETCTAHYLAGCDGASSKIRHDLGLGFKGGTYKQIFYVADVILEGIEPANQVHIALDESDFVAVFPYGKNGKSRLIGILSNLEEAERCKLTFNDVSQVAIERLGIIVKSVSWFSTYKVHHRITDNFRKGSVFLLGDAAHIHSPAGGQGMNTGISDAINLAWKLNAVIKKYAPDRLLDTYDQERTAFAYKLVETTDRIFTFITTKSTFAHFVRTAIAPLFMNVAYRIDHVREYIFRMVSQTMLEYCDSTLSIGKTGKIRAGERLPWVSSVQDNYTSLKQITWQVHIYGTAKPDLKVWCNTYKIPLHEFEWLPAHQNAGLVHDALYLLRPDTYIAFTDAQGSAQAVSEYFNLQGYDLKKVN